MAAKKSSTRNRKRLRRDLDDDDDDDSDVVLVVEPSGNWLTRLLFRPRRLMLLALVLSAVYGAPRLSRLLPDLQRRAEYRVPASRIAISELPRWVPSDLTSQVMARAGLSDELSLLD